MYRTAIEQLYRWKESKHRKPLIIEGARQVGKTWLMKEFGRKAYPDTIYINFDSNSRMAELFSADLNPDRLILGIELYAGKKIDPEKTLLIFDEIQEIPRALAALKYFCEDAPQYHIVCAGSLLGIALHEGTSFPVGKIQFLKLYPLSFREFLMAVTGRQYADLLDRQDYSMITPFRQVYIDALKQYYFIGGMPEAVQHFAQEKDFQSGKSRNGSSPHTNRISPNMPLPLSCLGSVWSGTAFLHSLQRKTRNLSTALCGKAAGPKIMKRLSCGCVTADCSTRSAG